MQPFQALIFDLDGVIIDSEPLHEESARIVFQRYGLEVPAYLFDVYKGKTDRDVIRHVILEYSDDALDLETLIEEKQQAYRDLLPHLQLVPGADGFIRAAARQYRLALTTSSILHNQRIAFEAFGLDAYFEVVVTAQDITRAKPDPEPYQVTVERLGLAPSACLVLEDSVNGVISAAAAGCAVAGLLTSFSGEALVQAGAHLVVSDYQALADEIGLTV